jgi:hypothetical protein
MALAASLATLVAVVVFALVASALGHKLLHLCSVELPSSAEHLLCAAAAGIIAMEVLLFFVQLTNHVSTGVLAVLVVSCVAGTKDFAAVGTGFYQQLKVALDGTKNERILAAITGCVIVVEALAAMAPLTGSDALHYHFTAPLLTLESGFHPNFFLSHSFFCGQSHLLILMGLALGSSQFAMGLIFLGGLLAAAACACLMRRWADEGWAWAAALVFLLTPVTFWQISSAGAPDVWMAFFATVGVLVISRAKEMPSAASAILAGVLAGAVAGTKYTGCFIAASMAIAYFWEVRSVVAGFLFALGSLAAGIWPYARNLAWTGDPLFPFLTSLLSPSRVNAYALASYRADTGAGPHSNPWEIAKFVLFAQIDPQHLGFWQFLGPIVLAFTPFLLLAMRRSAVWRVTLTVWLLSAIGIGWSSEMTRFLLPLLPIAVAATLAGVAQLRISGWRIARYLSVASLGCFLTFGMAGLLYYNRSALAEATGFVSREEYLRMRAPEYEQVRFVNNALAGKRKNGKALVFIRHLFYLRVPFVHANPEASWAINPAKFQNPNDWLELFREQNIRWVVRSPVYPPEIAAPLTGLEMAGKLSPIAQTSVPDFEGLRISERRGMVPIVVFKVEQ